MFFYSRISKFCISPVFLGLLGLLALSACAKYPSYYNHDPKITEPKLKAPWLAKGRFALNTGQQGGQAQWELRFKNNLNWQFRTYSNLGFGIVLPLEIQKDMPGLPYWINGSPLPGEKFEILSMQNQQLEVFKQDSWKIQYLEHSGASANKTSNLPRTLRLERRGIKIKVIIDERKF
ncbi:MAG: lipoprotein insertase outer membrane protein LolB [Gammaproteobacteria bacterium]